MRLISADDAALAAGVSPATLRDWVRRGLLTPYGSPRQRAYCPRQLARALDAPKPRRAADTQAA